MNYTSSCGKHVQKRQLLIKLENEVKAPIPAGILTLILVGGHVWKEQQFVGIPTTKYLFTY